MILVHFEVKQSTGKKEEKKRKKKKRGKGG